MKVKEKSACLSSEMAVSAILLSLAAATMGLGFFGNDRPLLKFCYNSRDQFVAAQCVLCEFYKFSATVLACNGRTSALQSNISSTEAVCIISNCLQQVRQPQPQFIGRRRRDAEAEPSVGEENKQEEDFGSDEDGDGSETSMATGQQGSDEINTHPASEDTDFAELEKQVVDTIEVYIRDDDFDEFEEE